MERTISPQKFTGELRKLNIDTDRRNSWRRETWTHMGEVTPCLHLWVPGIPFPAAFGERFDDMRRMLAAGWQIAFKRSDYNKLVAFMGETPKDVTYNAGWLVISDDLHLMQMAPFFADHWKATRIGQLCQRFYREMEEGERMIAAARKEMEQTRKDLSSDLDQHIARFALAVGTAPAE